MLTIKTLLVALSAISISEATTLRANRGCVIAKDFNGKDQKLCEGGTLNVRGSTTVKACIVKEGDGTYAYCEWKGDIPTGWTLAYFGENNCMYSAGKTPVGLGCSGPIGRTKVENVYG